VRRLAPLLAAAALLLAGCGGEELVTERIGDGPAAVTMIRPEGLDDDVPVVLFLHGWGATEPRAYRPGSSTWRARATRSSTPATRTRSPSRPRRCSATSSSA